MASNTSSSRTPPRTSHDSRSFRLRASAFFALINLVIIWLVALRYLPWLDVPGTLSGWAFLVTTWLGHFGVLAMLGWLPLGLLALFLRRRWMILPATLIATLGLWALALDTEVFAQYRFHVNHFMLSMFLHDSNGDTFSFSLFSWLMAIGVMLGFALIELWLAWRLFSRAREVRFPVWKSFIVLLLLAIASHVIHLIGDARYNRSVTQQTAIYPLFYPATAKDFMEKHGWLDPRAAREQGLKMGGSHDSANLDWPKTPLNCQPGADAPNVLIVLLDSWRFDELDDKTTPNMAAVARNGARFTQHYSGGNGTRSGTFSLLYGLSGNYWQFMENSQTPSLLIRTLQQHDYPLGIFASASLNGVGLDRTAFASVPDLRLRTHQGDTPAARDAHMTEEWLEWQQNRRRDHPDQPWFGFLFYDAPHGYSVPDDAEMPWQPSARQMEYARLGPNTDPTPIRNLHRNAAHYDDRLIGRVIRDLKSHGEWENTMVVFTSDHGQEFNDSGHNYWGHNGNFTRWQTGVPLVIHGPGVADEVHHGRTSHFSVVPTLMTHALNCSNPPSDYSLGHDLLGGEVDRSWVEAGSYTEYGILEKDRITEISNSGDWTVYDRQMNPLPEQDFSPAVFDAVQAMKRFFR
ncbi:hypothetical protein C7446_0145 [Kushneria sinocarnis]|uniref:DUF3413 domain-containing protein n=1 Tax=Kushneria sinocarnis TaxID=595502 RepID=A0A420X0P0_9GAMM|nr:DUF3413 domain-containing protein [Kushneria sinocarnis]RKR07334.1 hypothetical protein C7446_0145 [Kushneria sinocarnis]